MNFTEKTLQELSDKFGCNVSEEKWRQWFGNEPMTLDNVTTKEIKDFISKKLSEQAKAYGGCEKCYGKGYSTEKAREIGSEDFGGEGYVKNLPIRMNFCRCERGKQLEKLLDQKLNEQRVGFNQSVLRINKLLDDL